MDRRAGKWGLLFAKAALVGTPWLFGYYGLESLPLSIASPILHFIALAQPDALISLISPVRRTSVAVSFLLGIVLLRETRVPAKSLCVAGIIAGVLLLA